MTPDTDDDMAEAIALYRVAAMRCLAILGLAATSLLRRLPTHQRLPEAERWAECLVSVMRLDATTSAAVH